MAFEGTRDAAALGIVAGLRSQLPLALLSLAARQDADDGATQTGVLGWPAVTALLLASAAGEIVVDKLPITPSRLMLGSLIFRTGIGCLAGGVLARRAGLAPALGATCGGVGALAGSYLGYSVRASLGRATGLPDPLFAAVEDVAAIALGRHAIGAAGRTASE